ncbi:MAG: DUF4129 domain-containing protein [Thermoplasmata archaeon]|nr:DUF4129 domain-containing protein [Thermoplasmata archaeon]
MRRALLTTLILTVLLFPQIEGEISHEDYDRAQMNIQIVHLFLSAAFSKAEASAMAAAEGDLQGARENLTYFKRAIESAFKTLEEVNPEVPSYTIIKMEIENLSSLYTPLLDIVDGYLDLNEYLADYRNLTLPYSALLQGAASTVENLTYTYDIYRAANEAKGRVLKGVEALPGALQNISSAYNTSRMEEALRVVGGMVEKTVVPPFLLQVLSPAIMCYEGDVALSLLRMPTGGEIVGNLSKASAAFSSAYTTAGGGLRDELSQVVPQVVSEYRTLLGIFQEYPNLVQMRSLSAGGNFYERVEAAYTSLGIVQRMVGGIEELNSSHRDLILKGVGNNTLTSAIEQVKEWLATEVLQIYQRINFTEEIEHLSNLSSESLFYMMWEYDRNGNGRLDGSEILAGWNITQQGAFAEEVLMEVAQVQEAIRNFSALFSSHFLSFITEMATLSQDLNDLYTTHHSFLLSLEDAVKMHNVVRLKDAWGRYGMLNSTMSKVLDDIKRVESQGAHIENSSVERAVEMVSIYRRFLEEFSNTTVEGFFIYISRSSYPLGDRVEVHGYAYRRGPLAGWVVNITALNKTLQVPVSPSGTFSCVFEIPLNTTPGRYYVRATMGNMTSNVSFQVTLIPASLSIFVEKNYAVPGERINYTFTAVDLWGDPLTAQMYVGDEFVEDVEGEGAGVLVIEEYGLHAVYLHFPGDEYHAPTDSTPFFINISLPLLLTLEANSTTLYKNSTINITVKGAPPGRIVSLITSPLAYMKNLTSPSWSFNITLRWVDFSPGEYLLWAVYRAQDPVYRDSRSPPIVIVVLNYTREEVSEGGKVAEKNVSTGGNDHITPPPYIPVPLPKSPQDKTRFLEIALVIVWGVSILLLYLYFMRGRERMTEAVSEVVEEAEEEEEEEAEEEEEEETKEVEEVFLLYWDLFRWARERGAEVHEYMTPREFMGALGEVAGDRMEELRRFVELFEIYVYSPRGDEEHLRRMREIVSVVTGGEGSA